MIDFQYVLDLEKRDTDINEHLRTLYTIPFAMGAKTIVEIGAGQSTFTLTAVANALESDFYSIDLYESATTQHAPVFKEGEGVLEKEPRCHRIIGDSLEVAKTWDKEIDFFFLDSGHTYELTRDELQAWTPFVRKGGVICLHDMIHTDPILVGCRKAFDEWIDKNKFPYIIYPNRNGFSIVKII